MKKRSKRKATLKLLEYAANAKANVKQWPRYEQGFSHLSVQLSKTLSSAVVDNTWDNSSLEDWTWDEYNEHFTFDVVSMFRVGLPHGPCVIRMSSPFYFDPHKDLLKELDRVSDEIKAYADALLHMRRSYFATKATDARSVNTAKT